MRVAVCAIAKNENLYLREWVEWYKNLGMSKIFLYDDNDPDGERFEEVIDDYIKSGFVEVIDVRGSERTFTLFDYNNKAYRCSLQHKCYIDCYKEKLSDFDWVFFCDIDEFLEFRDEYTLESYLGQEMFDDVDTIMIPWVTYDDNNLVHYDDRPVVERFTHLSKYQWLAVKSFARTNKYIFDDAMRHMIHCFKLYGMKMMFGDGSKVTYNDNINNFHQVHPSKMGNMKCVLNHYKTKTIEEYLKRRVKRFWTSDGFIIDPKTEAFDKIIDDFFTYCEKTDEKLKFINQYIIENKITSRYYESSDLCDCQE